MAGCNGLGLGTGIFVDNAAPMTNAVNFIICVGPSPEAEKGYQASQPSAIMIPMGKDRLTLKDELKNGDLEAFIALAEAEGFGAADAEAFKSALTAAAKTQQSKRQTSR